MRIKETNTTFIQQLLVNITSLLIVTPSLSVISYPISMVLHFRHIESQSCPIDSHLYTIILCILLPFS